MSIARYTVTKSKIEQRAGLKLLPRNGFEIAPTKLSDEWSMEHSGLMPHTPLPRAARSPHPTRDARRCVVQLVATPHPPPRPHCAASPSRPPPPRRTPPALPNMTSRVTVKQMRSKLKLLGLPIHGTKDIVVERCRVHGVSFEGPGSAAGMTGFPSTNPTPATPSSAAPLTPDHLQNPAPPPPRDAAASELALPSISMACGAGWGESAIL